MSDGTKIVIGLVIGFFALMALLIINPFVVVSAGERGVVLHWGAVEDQILGEGIHWITPIAKDVKTLDVKIQKEQVEATAASKDLQTVTTVLALNYHLQPDRVNALWQNVGEDYKSRIIDPAIQESVKGVTAKYTAEELVTKRPLVKDDIKVSLLDRLQKEFIIVDEVSIVNFDFSESFNKAIEMKVTAEQDALAQKNKLEQVKYEAEQRVTQAKAEAEAIKIQAQAITQQGGQSYVDLKAIEKWNGSLPTQMIPGSTIPFINLTK